MAARTRAQVEADMARLQAELDGADTDDEIWIKDPSGHEVKVTGRRATSVLDKFKELWDTPGEEGEGEQDKGEQEDPPPSGGYFGRDKK
jgi:hypothetical protein